MTDELAQDERVASLQTPLGRNTLAIALFEVPEALSELFEFSIDALSRDPDIDFDKALGRSCCVTIAAYAGPKRHFDGVLVHSGEVEVRQARQRVVVPTDDRQVSRNLDAGRGQRLLETGGGCGCPELGAPHATVRM